MSRVSIVGVDGSGKTVLMAALGERYETPDEYGFFLDAETKQTFDTVKMLMDRMRNGEWPPATEKSHVTSLNWTLYRKTGNQNTAVSSISFLDYGGEIYRLGFGEHSEDEKKTYAKQIAALREHIESSDVLIVLVNLKDIISGNCTDSETRKKAREMMWISKSILDFALSKAGIAHVALAFSQYEVYRDEIEAAGGLEGAYRKFLRHVANMHPDLKLFAVAAVDKTETDAAGFKVPARDFSSRGLEELIEWIVSKIPGHENDISDIKELPSRLWTSLKGEVRLALSDSGGTLGDRLDHAKRAAGLLEEFEGVGETKRVCVATEDDVRKVRDQLADFRAKLEQAMPILADLKSSSEEKSADELRAWLQAHDVAENLIDPAVDEIGAVQRVRRAQREKARARRRGLLIAESLILIAGLAVGGWKWWAACQRRAAAEFARKINVGYSSCVVNGKRMARWGAGTGVPANSHLKTDVREGTYVAVRPGYAWVPGTLEDRWTPGARWNSASDDILADANEGAWRSNRAGYRVVDTGSDKALEWTSGLVHPSNPILRSCAEKGRWECVKPGYRWEGDDRTSWCAGIRHPADGRLVATETDGVWKSVKPGYVWNGGDAAVWKPGQPHADHAGVFAGEKEGEWVTDRPGYGVDSNFTVVWRPGLRHPNNKRLASASVEGQWTATEPGYEWSGGTSVRWNVGSVHPFNSDLKASNPEGTWVSTRPGYRWTSGSHTEWQEGVRHPDNSNLVSESTEGQWRSTRPGYVWNGGATERWKAGSEHPTQAHVIASVRQNSWHPAPGYSWVDPDNKTDMSVKWVPGTIDKASRRKASSSEGRWLRQVDCSICNGTGRKSGQVDCPRCDGRGTVSTRVSCSNCSGTGKTETQGRCSGCNGMTIQQFNCDAGCQPFTVGFMTTRGFRCPCGGGGVCMQCYGTGLQICKKCSGTGRFVAPCPRCGGMGLERQRIDCLSCGGSGRVNGTETCSRCGASGKVSGKVACTYCGRDGCADGKVWESE